MDKELFKFGVDRYGEFECSYSYKTLQDFFHERNKIKPAEESIKEIEKEFEQMLTSIYGASGLVMKALRDYIND